MSKGSPAAAPAAAPSQKAAPAVPDALEGFPSKQVEVVTRSGVGSGGDMIGRQVIEAAKDFVPDPMIMMTKKGAASANV